MQQNEIISTRILEDMSDGVMTIDLSGKIITFNPAAAKILGISREDAAAKTFGEVFFMLEENDDFNQVILDAIYESAISHNRVVTFNNGDICTTLSLTTSFLQTEEDGARQKIGVIAVFIDISELRKAQDAEAKMAEELKAKHKELQGAYLETEESNRNLNAALKKVQVIRVVATLFSILLFLGLGLFYWNRSPLAGASESNSSMEEVALSSSNAFTVSPELISSSISMIGKLSPLQTVNITSPISGEVEQVNFNYGDVVKAGQMLLAMDTSEAQIKYREAKATYIKAVENFRLLENWTESTEVARARRSLSRSQLSLNNQKKNLDETERLFDKGIIPANELESVKQQYTSQLMDHQSAEEEMRATLGKGNNDNLEIARFEMENALTRLKKVESELARATVVAPVSGIAMKPATGSSGKVGKSVERGSSFTQGEAVLAIGDLAGFSVTCMVDEVDVGKVKQGQKVRISGDAYQGEQLEGVIRSISPQATDEDGDGIPSFAITITVEQVTEEQRKVIMVGMSANLEIVIHEILDALMVPISAVLSDGGKYYLIKNQGSASSAVGEKVEVEVGYTTIDSVEIISGINAGDIIESVAID
ncbi:MAG: efflux RND transporter periplasmic adaptor subunit [Desulfuromonadales bacterium]|nr:efflux RND transporter periplasmic adaptor subunit [Desulfuromonadales bacterium]